MAKKITLGQIKADDRFQVADAVSKQVVCTTIYTAQSEARHTVARGYVVVETDKGRVNMHSTTPVVLL